MPGFVFQNSPINTSLFYYINPSGDRDWFRFFAPLTGTITVNLTNLPADYDLYVYFWDGQLLGQSTQAGQASEQVSLLNAAPGDYYVAVTGANGAWSATVRYLLRFNALDVVTLPVMPVLDCILPNPNGYTAYFGYNNPNTSAVTIFIGPDNFFWPDPQDRGQPTVFPPGQYAQIFSVPVGGGGGAGPALADDLVWTLNGLTAGASGDSPQCP
jgi:hypothetical protein